MTENSARPTGTLDASAADDGALALVGRGFAVFPLRPNSKTPAVHKDWEGAATSEPRRIKELWRDPAMNIGIACGPSNLLVVDLDVPKGPDPGQQTGADALRELAAGREIPRTLTVTTPSGGHHLYFRRPDGLNLRNTAGRLGPLIDTRAAGGYVVGPGSNIGGKPYEITTDAPVAPLPGWLLDELQPADPAPLPAAADPADPQSQGPDTAQHTPHLPDAYAAAALRAETRRVATAREGTRNDTLNRAAYSLGQLVGTGLIERGHAAAELQQAGRAAGLPDREAAATIASGLDAGIARPRVIPVTRPWTTPRSAASQSPSESPSESQSESQSQSPSQSQSGAHGTGPEPAAWAEIFANFGILRTTARNLRRELAAVDIAADDMTVPIGGADALPAPDADLTTTLREIDAAYDTAALRAAPLLYTPEWHRIRTVTDALRDLRDEIEFGAADFDHELQQDARLRAALHALASRACHTISLLAFEISRRLSLYGQRNSPVWRALWQLHKTADTATIGLLGAPAISQLAPASSLALRKRRR